MNYEKKRLYCNIFLLLFALVILLGFVLIVIEGLNQEVKTVRTDCYDGKRHKIIGAVCSAQVTDFGGNSILWCVIGAFGMGITLGIRKEVT